MFTENSGISTSFSFESSESFAVLPFCDTGCDTRRDTSGGRSDPRHAEFASREARPRKSGRAATPIRHLTRRGAVWYFRKRVPERFRTLGVRAAWCLSLRTTSLPEAAARSLRLLAALDAIWSKLDMNMMSGRPLDAAAIEQVVNEILIRELARIIGETEGGLARGRDEAEAALARIEAERRDLREEAARRDYGRAKDPASEALAELGCDPSPDPEVRQRLYARSFAALRKINGFERQLEEGDAVEECARGADIPGPLVQEARLRMTGRGVTVGRAFDAAIERKYAGSKDNQNHARAAKRVALDMWGDRPLSSLTENDFIDLLMFMRRLPVPHGRNHGNNRHAKGRPLLNKRLEVEAADAADADLRAAVERLDIPEREKRELIRAGLTPRLNMKTLGKHHAFIRAAFIAAKDHLDHGGPVMPVVFSTFKARAKVMAETEAAEGRSLSQRRRRRLSWSDERLTTLFTSPIYSGCRRARRHMKGDEIIRDAIYWCPLIVATAGLRPEEALRLAKDDVVRRNGILAFHVHDSKTESSERFVPVPAILLRLGFAEWINGIRELPGRFLFPEVADVATQARLSEIFGGRFTQIRKGLDIIDAEEDFYALRRTFNSRLTAAGVPLPDCQSLLGHRHGDITNLHYTDRRLKELKALVDRVDYHLEIVESEAHGFPIIVACRLDERTGVEIEIDIDDHGYGRRVSWEDGEERVSVGIAPMRSWPSWRDGEPDPEAVHAPTAALRLASALGDRAPRFGTDAELGAWEYLMSLS